MHRIGLGPSTILVSPFQKSAPFKVNLVEKYELQVAFATSICNNGEKYFYGQSQKKIVNNRNRIIIETNC